MLYDAELLIRSGLHDPSTLLSSNSWEGISQSLHRGALGAGLAATGGEAMRGGMPPQAELIARSLVQGAAVTAASAEILAQIVQEIADRARQREQAAEKEHTAREQREAVERAQVQRFERSLREAGEQHEERVRNGEFLREYRDSRTKEQMEQRGRIG